MTPYIRDALAVVGTRWKLACGTPYSTMKEIPEVSKKSIK